MAKRKVKVVKQAEPEFKQTLSFCMNYNSNVALALRLTPNMVAAVRISADGLKYEAWGADKFLREFNRDLLDEEWSALVKFLKIALRNDGNDHMALVTLTKGFEMKLAELKEKSMEELVSMHNELAKAAGVKEVTEFKSLEKARLAVVKLANTPTKGAKTKEAAAATGKGVAGRPRSGVGAFAKEVILKGGTNAEVLAKVKEKFPNNATTVSCIAYYRNALVKAGQLEGGRKPKEKKEAAPAKPVKGKSEKKAPKAAAATA